MDQGVIRYTTTHLQPLVVLVKKKDGNWRMCIDYREINKATIKDKFSIPIIEVLLEELHGTQYFSNINLKASYHHIRVHENDINKSAFKTHFGHFEFLVMPFGYTDDPSTFRSLMNHIFKSFLRKYVLVFFDDILIYSHTWEAHVQHLKTVLTLMQYPPSMSTLKSVPLEPPI